MPLSRDLMEKKSQPMQFLRARQLQYHHAIDPKFQLLSDLHILPYGRMLAETLSSADYPQGDFSGVRGIALLLPFVG
jgi:hypothetical protein